MASDSNLSGQQPSKKVAIVVPLSTRPELTPDEEISYRHLIHFLGKYDKYLVMAERMDVRFPGFGVKKFDNRFFGSSLAYAKLILAREFYEAFSEYEYILIYQLDVLVFSDQLMEWCETGLDYIGAPWFKSEDTPWEEEVPYVGNGGFSLRNIASCLKVLDSPRYSVEPAEYWKRYFTSKPKYIRYLNLPRIYLKHLKRFNNVKWELSRFTNNADQFWSRRAVNYYPEFKIASVEEGLRFAFEVAPKRCFEMNNYQLPFGCHAWAKYDRGFWGPYLLKEPVKFAG